MDSTQQHQVQSSGPPAPTLAAMVAAGAARREPPRKEAALNCPRCNSTNTKFCYYNNYSLSQPRYLCRTCRRYWTEHGLLWNKNRPSSAASAVGAAVAVPTSDTVPVGLDAKNPKLMHEYAHDLNLAFPHHGGRDLLQPPEFVEFPSLETSGATAAGGNSAASSGVGVLSAMELLVLRRSDCYVDEQLTMPAERFRVPTPPPDPETRGAQGAQESAGSRLLFPFKDLRPVASAAGDASTGADQGDGGGEASGMVTAVGHETAGFDLEQ